MTVLGQSNLNPLNIKGFAAAKNITIVLQRPNKQKPVKNTRLSGLFHMRDL